MLKKFNFTHAIDLQNSSRTSFYRRFLLEVPFWSSTETILKKGEKKSFYKNDSVLKRFKIKLERSNIKAKNTLKQMASKEAFWLELYRKISTFQTK